MQSERRTGSDMVGTGKAMAGDALPPWPDEWPAPRPKLWMVLNAGYLSILTLLACGLGSWALLSGQPGPAAFLLGGGVYLGLGTSLCFSLLRTRRRVSPKAITLRVTGSGEDGVLVAYASWLYRCLAAIMLLTFLVFTGSALSGLAGWVVPPFATPPNALSTGIFITAGLYFLWIVIDIASGRLARGRVVLGPHGIYHRSVTFEHFAPWDTVHTVAAEDVGGPLVVAKAFPSDHSRVRRTSRVGKQQEFQMLPYVAVRGRSLAVDPAVLYHALRYYHAHPEARAELTTEAGLHRIRGGNLLG
ncbi:MAG: hypothetical protein ACRDS9_06665 [Pseudonocardiaceae bacterium]